ncbi:MAG: MFS transporter [Chloroflexi bacterium]|nr:MFS transporter [Chloroflexota bacterium]
MEAATDSLHRSRYRIVIAGLILAAHLAVGLNMFAVSPILLIIIDDLSINRATAGLLVAMPMLVAAIFGLPGGLITMRLGLRRTYGAAWVAMGLLALSPLAPNFLAILTLRLLFGLGAAMMFTASGPLLLQWFKPKEVLVMNGLNSAILSLGIFLSLATAVPLAEALEWKGALGVFGVVGVLGALAWGFLGRVPARDGHLPAMVPLRGVFVLLRSRAMLLLLAADAGVFIQYTALSAWLPTFYAEVRGMTLGRAALITALLPLVGVFAVIAGALIPLKFGAPRIFLIVPGIMIIVGGLASFNFSSTPVIYASVILIGVGSWLYVPTLLSWTMQLAGMVPGNVAIVWGALITVSGIGMFLSPILVGFLRDASGTFTLGFLICSAAAWSLLLAGIFIPGGFSFSLSQDESQAPV